MLFFQREIAPDKYKSPTNAYIGSPGSSLGLGLLKSQARAQALFKPVVGPGWAGLGWAGLVGLAGLKPGPAHHYAGDALVDRHRRGRVSSIEETGCRK